MFELPPIRLLLVDDHALFRNAVLKPLQANPHIDVVGTAPDGAFAQQMCRDPDRPIDVLLMDLHMPHLNGFEVLSALQDDADAPRCLFLTGDATRTSVQRALRLGAAGYMLKDNATEESIAAAIVAVAEGGVFIDTELCHMLLDAIDKSTVTHRSSPIQLNPFEENLLRAVALGATNKSLAITHSISTKTVSNRLSLLYMKLGVNNRVQAAMYALRYGFLSLDEVILPSKINDDS